jgi:uncharacterized protein with von Willebrand factor type A (vWA) domain
MSVSMLGDARSGKLAENIVGFGRMLRRAGLPIDSSRLALGLQAVEAIDIGDKDDLRWALESVLVSREHDRVVFHELFDALFRNPEIAKQLLAQLLPVSKAQAPAPRRRPRSQEALSAPPRSGQAQAAPPKEEHRLDAAMSMSDQQRLKQADFEMLSASEYRLVQQLAARVALPIPQWPSRRRGPGQGAGELHWAACLRRAAQTGGEFVSLPTRVPRMKPLPLLILVDVSGSMERYARMLLAFLHAATRGVSRRVFAFGSQLTDLSRAFRVEDPDEMLVQAAQVIPDFAGGTRMADSLRALRTEYRGALIGRRSVVLLISDGLDTGDLTALQTEVSWLSRQSQRLVWLNPLLRFDGYAPLAGGASVLARESHAMLAVHNLSRLEELAEALRQLLRR